MNRILVVAAHPDDEILGCGGTLAKHINNGDSVRVLFLSDGVNSRESSDLNELKIRKINASKACEIIGINDLSFADFPDNKLDTVPLIDIVKCIENDLKNFKPNLVYTHSNLDLNIDHQIVNRALITATRPQIDCSVKTILAFEVLSSTEWFFSENVPAFKPNWFEDISFTLDKKISAIKIYKDELRAYPHPRSLKSIKNLAEIRGASVGVNAAEAFSLIRHIK
jgi:LmbE family N-acetylglucosaminyl deacetylase